MPDNRFDRTGVTSVNAYFKFLFKRQDLNDVIVFLEKPQYFIFKKYFISLVRFGGHWYQTLFANQLKPFQ